MTEKAPQPVDLAHVESAIAVALKLARFRPTRNTLDSDEVCRRAAAAVMQSFARSRWRVVREGEYLGYTTADGLPHFGGKR